MKKKIIPNLICILILSCSQKETNTYIIPQEELIPMLCDFHIFDAASKQGVISNNRNNLVRHQHYNSILLKYKVERSKFDSTISYYSQRPEEHKILYQKVEAQLIEKLGENHAE
tara:strand:+ start:2632 stop:2973 length:342 start_codon:yes stop_codon:yes gene_type:complete